ncbi:MAG TPA: hypothetical protein VMK32_04545 [Burkholderiaceae bacterium]|nr:hypothetical protein [Burkholderiaceae bacterium]
MTAPADRELRALRIELLRARAEMERQLLLQQIDAIGGRTRAVRGIARALAGRRPSERALNLAATAIGLVRRQPWIVPTVAGIAVRALRIRALRWALLVGGAAAAAWWLIRGKPAGADAPADDANDPAAEASPPD